MRLITLLSLLALGACQNVPKSLDAEQSVTWLITERSDDGRLYINEELSGCYKRTYRYSIDFNGPVTKSVKKPVQDCHKSFGFTPKENEKVVNYHEAVRELIKEKYDESND